MVSFVRACEEARARQLSVKLRVKSARCRTTRQTSNAVSDTQLAGHSGRRNYRLSTANSSLTITDALHLTTNEWLLAVNS